MYVSTSPPSWLGHCPHCNNWVEMKLKSCPHCNRAFTQDEIKAIQEECSKRKQDKKSALLLVLLLAIAVGIYVFFDLELYSKWL